MKQDRKGGSARKRDSKSANSARSRRRTTAYVTPDTAVQEYLRSLPPEMVNPTLSRAIAIGVRVLQLQRGSARAAWMSDQLNALLQQMSKIIGDTAPQ